MFSRVPARASSVSSSLPEVGNSLPIEKLLYFDLRMTTAINSEGSVGSWQSVNYD